MCRKVVLKLPGAGLIQIKDTDSPIPWHSYRGISISTSIYHEILDIIIAHREKYKFFISCGSTGSFMYTEFAKKLGASPQELDSIGVTILNLMNNIFINFLSKHEINVCQKTMLCSSFNETINLTHDVYIIEGDEKHASTDHLLIDIAKKISSDYTFFIKQGIPEFYVGFDNPTSFEKINIQDIIKISETYSEAPGKKYILDRSALCLIKKYNIPVCFVPPENIAQIGLILSNCTPTNVTWLITDSDESHIS